MDATNAFSGSDPSSIRYYTVAEATEMTGIKSYVLRYWEEELELRIHRNPQGHRCYTRYDIQLFLNVKELKARGLQLRAIRELIPQLTRILPGMSDSQIRILTDGAMAAKKEKVPAQGNDRILEFQKILERLIAQELHRKREGEDRWQNLDAAIRRQQMVRREAAAAAERNGKRRG